MENEEPKYSRRMQMLPVQNLLRGLKLVPLYALFSIAFKSVSCIVVVFFFYSIH